MLDEIVELYQTLTGKKVATQLIPQYMAWGRRAIRELENKLGWSFDSPTSVNVLGCTPNGCECDIDVSKLKEAPEEQGSFRFFPIDARTPFIHTDPFTKVYAVYLCKVEPEGINITSDDGDVVVMTQIEKFTPRYCNSTFGKYIQACEEVSTCQAICNQDCTNCSALLVDADWVSAGNLPDDLLYLLCDYIDWMANSGVANRNIKSESVDGHSVSYGNWQDSEPYLNPSDVAIIQLYAGPYGMVDRKLIW